MSRKFKKLYLYLGLFVVLLWGATITIDVFTESQFVTDIAIPLSSSLIGGFLALYGAKISIDASSKQLREEFEIERNKINENSIMALKIEIRENLELLENMLPKANNKVWEVGEGYVRLSDLAWNNCRYLIGFYENDIVDVLCKTYAAVKKVNDLANASLSHGKDVYPTIFEEMKQAIKYLKKAQEKLDTFKSIQK